MANAAFSHGRLFPLQVRTGDETECFCDTVGIEVLSPSQNLERGPEVGRSTCHGVKYNQS